MTKRALGFVALGAAATLLLSACGGGGGAGGGGEAAFNQGETEIVNPSDEKGGTLRYAHSSDFDSTDPGNMYYAFAWNFSRYYARTLLTYTTSPGVEGTELQPDLAEGMPEVSDDGKTYTVKLKKGLKYENGEEIVAEDVKYAIARSNYGEQRLPNGPQYFKKLLADSEDYEGPYADSSDPLQGFGGIETPDDHTLVFHLKKPFSEFEYILIQPQSAPVPAEVDKGVQYQSHVLSSGPYKFDGDYKPEESLNLVRNDEWDAATDPIRKALPDRIEVELGVEQNEIDQRLVNGQLDVDLSTSSVGPAMKGTVLSDEAKKANVDNPSGNTMRYVNINTKVEPLDDLACRQAVMFAVDHDALQRAWGGPVGGDIPTQIMPTSLEGADTSIDLYPSEDNKGDLDKAKAKLEECGEDDGFKVNIGARSDRPADVATAEALQASLKRAGIGASIKQYPSDTYTNTQAGSPDFVHDNELGLTVFGWAPDWPTGYGFMSEIVNGESIRDAGNANISEFDDPEVNKLFAESVKEQDPEARADKYAQIDRIVMENAVILPVVLEKMVYYRPENLTNAYYHVGYAGYDFMALGTTRE
ncbi:peptide ABC transporter substrate-binding protein [Nocardiopsis gilva YIM 90087]|uniref:Peptide ABC transporter substrate-binding protein n=1 Tax=Nocardiopsis gilva YIM 90087 TaxID=1235441 RepID=A0A223S6T6_9ACTN|nr:ABC transporter substrate-binding protein [Nocardiopsis gilva]ASU83759.1 peptide ABC transporter substrate-binding protein [Nocardiopsis gilva YIM 90087]